MRMKMHRRSLLAGAAAVSALPRPGIAQNKPVRIGLLTVKTGPLAQGGIQMEQGIVLFLKDRDNTIAAARWSFWSPIPAVILRAPRPRRKN